VSATVQIFVRNDEGRVWGPIALPTVELLIENRLIKGVLEISLDGVNFKPPGEMTELAGQLPAVLLGSAAGEVSAPATPEPPVAASAPPAGAFMAGPGAMAAARQATTAKVDRRLSAPEGMSVKEVHASVAAAPPPAAAPVAAPAPAPAAPAAAAAPVSSTDEVMPPPASGSLAETSFLHLYYLAASGNFTGLLTLQLPDRALEVHFRKGNPEYVGSSHPEDSVAGFLLKHNLVNPVQIADAEANLDKFGGELVGALFGMQVLNPGTAFALLAQRASGLLLAGLLNEEGTFSYEPKELPAHRVMPLGNRWAVLAEQVRKLPAAEVKRRLHTALDLPVMKSGGRVATSELRLTPQETRATNHFDGVRSLNELVAAMPQDEALLLRTAFLLKELEGVSFAAVPGRAAAGPPPPKAPPPAAAPKAPEAPRATPEQELKELKVAAEKARVQNLFEVLGVTEKSEPGAIKIAYFKLAKLYHPDTIQPNSPPELAKLKDELFARIGEAYRTLSDEKAKATYLDDLASGGEKVDVEALLKAEETFNRGTILVKARKFAEAVKTLDEAIAANPEEGEFYAWRGFARFFTHADKRAGFEESKAEIERCLAKNERCAPAHYFLGVMTKLIGEPQSAIKHFERCVQLQPDHTDAQRELRMLKK
jgi:tetratricopeptide (TPR) repeat protein